MKKFRAVIASVFTALTLICVSAMNTFAATLGKSTVVNPDSINNNTVKTGDNSQTIIFIVAGVAVVALAVIIISIIASFRRNLSLSTPPPYPFIMPFAPTTLWQGIAITIGFLLFAIPTALAAQGWCILFAMVL